MINVVFSNIAPICTLHLSCICAYVYTVNVCLFYFYGATFNNISVISWQSVLLVEETGISEENH